MIRVRYSVLMVSALAFLAPRVVLAIDRPRDIPLQIGILSQTAVTDLAQYIGLIYQYLTSIAGLFAVAMIMYGGMKWIFAGGDKGKIGSAQETIKNAVIGLILVAGSYVLLNTINPNLVRLQVPYVLEISSQRLAGAWCPNDGENAGRYRCGVTYTLQEDPGFTGKCVGSACDAGGCFQSAGAYACVDAAACPTSCADINTISAVTSDDTLRIFCESSLCVNAIPAGCRVWERPYGDASNPQWSGFPSHPLTRCIERIANGNPGCERNEDCQRGLMCNFGESPNICRPANALEPGMSCDGDQFCASRICNKGYARDQCAPDGGSAVGEPCDRDRDCGDPNSGRVCNVAFSIDSCVQKGSLPAGRDCDRDSVCQSGTCEGEEDDKDGDCAAS